MWQLLTETQSVWHLISKTQGVFHLWSEKQGIFLILVKLFTEVWDILPTNKIYLVCSSRNTPVGLWKVALVEDFQYIGIKLFFASPTYLFREQKFPAQKLYLLCNPLYSKWIELSCILLIFIHDGCNMVRGLDYLRKERSLCKERNMMLENMWM